MFKEKISKILNVSMEELDNNSKVYDDINATYYWNPERGGIQIIVSEDGSYLAATSGINPDALKEEFIKGRRNGNMDEVKDFIIKNTNPEDPFWKNKLESFFNDISSVSKEDVVKLIEKFKSNSEIFNNFTKDLLTSTNNIELFNKYLNLE